MARRLRLDSGLAVDLMNGGNEPRLNDAARCTDVCYLVGAAGDTFEFIVPSFFLL